MAGLRFPRSLVLTDFIFYTIVKFIFLFRYSQIIQAAFQEFGWLGMLFRSATEFGYGIIASWVFGSMSSELPLISFMTIVAYCVILFAICFRQDTWLTVVRYLIWLVFGLSMFTIWVEPWITVSGYAQWFLGSLAFGLGELLTIIDIIVSVIHFGLTSMLIVLVEKEFNNWDHPAQSGVLIEKKDRKNFLIVLLLHFFTLNICSYFYLGQQKRGIAMILFLIYFLLLKVFGWIWFPWFMLTFIDVYRIMYKTNRGQKVSERDAQTNWYTTSAFMMIALMFIK